MEYLLKELKDNNITISLNDDDLRVGFNGETVPERLIKKIKENKNSLVEYLKGIHHNFDFEIEKATVSGNYPLSSSQRRLWMLSQDESASIAYNMPGIYVFEGSLNIISLEFAFNTLINRHESLRTVFREDQNDLVRQYIYTPEELQFSINYQQTATEEDLRKCIDNELVKPFDLAAGPLIRVNVFNTNDNKCVLVYIMHHIISDGWSLNILTSELLLLYDSHNKGRQAVLPPLRIQYKDYAVWQQSGLNNEILSVQKKYWLKQFEGKLPVIELAKSKIRPKVRTYSGRTVIRKINSDLSRKLKIVLQQQSSSLFMGLLAIVYTLLYKNTGDEDIIIGSPIAGRENIDLENQIGFYANTLALRTQFNKEDSFSKLLGTVKKVTMNAFEFQLYPFDELIEALSILRDTSRNVLFDVWVVLHNTDVKKNAAKQDVDLPEISGYQGSEHVISKFDLLFGFSDTDGQINVSIDYNTDVLGEKEAQNLSDQFEKILTIIIKNPSLKLLDVAQMMNEDEKEIQKEHLQNVRMKNLTNLKNRG